MWTKVAAGLGLGLAAWTLWQELPAIRREINIMRM